MPMRHKYLIIISSDEEQILNIKKIFLGRFKIISAQLPEALELVIENDSDVAGVIIDDDFNNNDIICFLKTCFDNGVHERIPMFLLYSGHNQSLYINSIQLGIDEVINKPYLSEVLQRRVYHITDLFNHKYRLEWLVDTQTEELKESIQVLEDMKVQVLEALGTLVEFRNMESGEHIYRVRFLTDLLMREMQQRYPKYGITDEIVAVTDMASILHDIGKIMVSDIILKKPAKLNLEEFEEMKLHTYYGCQILEKLKGLYNDHTYRFYKDVICYHHEKYDGNGYPEGLKGDEIPIWSQVVALADVYDALTNERVYKKAYSHIKAKQMIFDGECGIFNPDLLNCFEHIQDRILEVALESHDENITFESDLSSIKQTSILNDYEKEKAFHRAYQELITEYYFEYDIEYGTVLYFNALGKGSKESYVTKYFPGINEKDEERLISAIKNSSPNKPVIHLTFNINEKGVVRRCEMTLRTTWDMYTGKRLGGVGKIEFIA